MSTVPDADALDDALVVARWAARRLASCEAHHFRAALRHSRSGCPRALARRERWRNAALEHARFLGAAGRELLRLGLPGTVAEIAGETAARIARANRGHLDAQGLPAITMLQFGLACRGGPPDATLN